MKVIFTQIAYCECMIHELKTILICGMITILKLQTFIHPFCSLFFAGGVCTCSWCNATPGDTPTGEEGTRDCLGPLH